MLRSWEFTDWETMFAAEENGKIIGMASLMKTDYYPLPDIYPWVSCIFVSEEARGHRISGMLIDYVNSYAKALGFTKTYIPTELTGLYEKYGYFKEDLYTITLKGIDGSRQIGEMMDKLRKNPPARFGELEVVNVRDYETGITRELATGKETPTGLPKSNVLYFDLTNDSWCCARPSGTEPKIKFYMGVKGTSLEDAKAKNEKLTEELKADHQMQLQTLVAYFYLRGLDFYGGMPIYRRSTTEESPRSTARETFNYVEELLLAAIPKLEKKTADMLEEGYLRQGTAAALLAQLYFNAEVYTGESRFAECAQICQDLLDGKYGYYELEEDWFGPFTFENNKSKEVMWSVQSQYAKGTLFQWQFERYNHYNAKNYFDLSGYSSTNGMHLQPSLKPNGDPYTDKLGRPFAKFHAKDLRKKLYVYKGNGKYEGMFLYGKLQRISRSGTEVKCTGLYEYPGEVLEFVDQVAQFKKVKDGEYSSVNELPSNISTGEENSGIRLCKLPVPDNTDKTLAFNPDYPVLRFAEIYYMLAECKYRSGYKKEAANLFNEVRKRNFENEVDPDPVTETNIDKYRILDEWMVEFLGEQRRRTDLRRWGLYTTGTWWDHKATNDDHYELFPIPEKSISVSNVLRQNPGYGGGNEMTKEEAGIYSVKQID